MRLDKAVWVGTSASIDWGKVKRLKAVLPQYTKWSSELFWINEFIVHTLAKGHVAPAVNTFVLFFKKISTLLVSYCALDLYEIAVALTFPAQLIK